MQTSNPASTGESIAMKGLATEESLFGIRMESGVLLPWEVHAPLLLPVF
jgi:hypothetical protein